MRRLACLLLLSVAACGGDAGGDTGGPPRPDRGQPVDLASDSTPPTAADTGYVAFDPDAAPPPGASAPAGPAASGGPDRVATPAPEPPPIDFDALPVVTDADFQVRVTAVPDSARVRKPEHVRGIYVNSWSAGSARRLPALLRLADTTEINAFVIDVKDATGQLSYSSSIPIVKAVGANRDIRIHDIREVLAQLRRHGVYPIARIVAFKDPVLARARPDWSVLTHDNRVWHDHHDDVWVDAYNENVWKYDLAIAREALALGFAEVQWDYVRFPDVPSRIMATAVYPARAGRSRTDAISGFMKLTRDTIHAEFDAPVTADVFGITTSAYDDVGIGQYWESMADDIDVLLPMVYPSHYPRGSFGIAHPNADPYHTIHTALRHGLARSRKIEGSAEIRPWLQDFSLGRPAYDAAHVRAQMRAAYDLGIRQWILWNPGSHYTEEALADPYGNEPYIPGVDALIEMGEEAEQEPAAEPDTAAAAEKPPLGDSVEM